MCGRYHFETDENALSDIVAEAIKNTRERTEQRLFAGGEVFPGDLAPVLTAGNRAQFMIWGFPNLNAGKRPHINARSETAAMLPTFCGAMSARRCIVPASGYYEWKPIGNKRKEKYEFTLPGRMPLYMAGVYSDDGRFAILTRAAVAAILDIHDRMPVIIPYNLIAVWINETADALRSALTDLRFERVQSCSGQDEQMSLFS